MPNPIITDILSILSLLALISMVLYLVIYIFARNSIQGLTQWIGKHSLLFSFLISVAGIIGSMVYSEVFKYEPCVLCWVQRIFLYPQAIIFFLALRRKDYRVWFYTLPLTVIGGLVALYHAYSQVSGKSLLPCTAEGGACAKVFFVEFGFMTIPAMAAISFLMLFFFALHAKYYSSRQ